MKHTPTEAVHVQRSPKFAVASSQLGTISHKERRMKMSALFGFMFMALISGCTNDNPATQTETQTDLSVIENPLSLITMSEFGGKEIDGYHDCFWTGPVSFVSYNIAYPDEGAVYWGTRFMLPEGSSHLLVEGNYPKARYFSFNTYDKFTQPIYALTDTEIAAADGANPFTSDDKSGGTYRITVKNGEAPANAIGSTLYLGDASRRNDELPLILRIYVPETGEDFTGGAGLPKVSLIMEDGSKLEGQTMCDAIGSPSPESGDRKFPTVVMEKERYLALKNHPDAPDSFPAEINVEWVPFWGGDMSISRYIPGHAYFDEQVKMAISGDREKRSGFYANMHNEYISAFISERHGDVLVLNGRLPRTPRSGWDITAGDYDMRYWSLCTNEHIVTTRYADCRYDDQIVTDQDGFYTIVVSKAENRPSNASEACGVTWIDWGERGDGAGDPSQGNLIIRNMLGDDFDHSIQNIRNPESAREDMGSYFPTPTYSTKSEFEAQGCEG